MLESHYIWVAYKWDYLLALFGAFVIVLFFTGALF